MLVIPPPLRAGDLVAVIAPSGPLPLDAFWRGLAWVRDRYRVLASPRILSRAGYFAGDDARRHAELRRALRHPDVKAVLVARGGYGAMRVLEGAGLEALADAPRWIVGFSDVTALHLMAARAGVASVHGPNVTGLGKASPADRSAWLAALERPAREDLWEGLVTVQKGTGRGVVCGGNVALVEAMVGAGRLKLPDGGVLMLEDVDERPYRLDRMLTSLRMGGHLSRLSAIVLGEFARCGAGPDGVTVDAVLAERTSGLGIPVLSNGPFGHGEVNRAFTLGQEAAVGEGRVRFLPVRA